MAEPTQHSSDQFSIHVVSADLDMGALMGSPNHNYISIRDSQGEEAFAIHGLALDRKTGNIEVSGNSEDTLRAMITNKNMIDIHANFDKDAEVQIFSGSAAEVAQKMNLAFDAMSFINDQNLVYDKFSLTRPAQNSNSVAHTVVTGMGLEFPEGIARHWAPGHERILLPENWKSAYDGNNLSEHKIQERVVVLAETVDASNVAKQAIADPVPDAGRGIFFNRKDPFTPYTPAGDEQPSAGAPVPIEAPEI